MVEAQPRTASQGYRSRRSKPTTPLRIPARMSDFEETRMARPAFAALGRPPRNVSTTTDAAYARSRATGVRATAKTPQIGNGRFDVFMQIVVQGCAPHQQRANLGAPILCIT